MHVGMRIYMSIANFEVDLVQAVLNTVVYQMLIAELSRAKRAQRSTMGKKMWSSTHPRKFGDQ